MSCIAHVARNKCRNGGFVASLNGNLLNPNRAASTLTPNEVTISNADMDISGKSGRIRY